MARRPQLRSIALILVTILFSSIGSAQYLDVSCSDYIKMNEEISMHAAVATKAPDKWTPQALERANKVATILSNIIEDVSAVSGKSRVESRKLSLLACATVMKEHQVDPPLGLVVSRYMMELAD